MTEDEIRSDEKLRIAERLRNFVTVDDGKQVPEFLNVADWLEGLVRGDDNE